MLQFWVVCTYIRHGNITLLKAENISLVPDVFIINYWNSKRIGEIQTVDCVCIGAPIVDEAFT